MIGENKLLIDPKSNFTEGQQVARHNGVLLDRAIPALSSFSAISQGGGAIPRT